MYRCGECGNITTLEELLRKSEGRFRCPECQSKILTKVRPKIIKRVKAI